MAANRTFKTRAIPSRTMMARSEAHPSPERTAAALEAAGLNPYLLLDASAVARTGYAEMGLSVRRDEFTLLTSEEISVPTLVGSAQGTILSLALGLAQRWGLAWRGSVAADRVVVSFGRNVPYRISDDPDEAGLRLHDAILDAHHGHQALKQRVLNAAWRSLPGSA